MKLVIVESPAKASTISRILGKDYDVTSSFGHVRDLAKSGDMNTGIDIAHNYKPDYIVTPDKKRVVNDLKKAIKKYDSVILATDEDREGEAISWHLKEVLKLPDKTTQRITFTEITAEAIKEAINNPRKIDKNLVDAQQARRVLDRLFGFALTALLWKKIRGQLSAGRVQSVAVKLVVDKEREILSFKPESYFKITGDFITKSTAFNAELDKDLKSAKEVEDFLTKCTKSTFVIESVDKKPAKKNPSPPFSTSTLQQLASQKLGFSVTRTMSTAQKLYEAGHITYMRTDSLNLSPQAIGKIGAYIKKEYGEEYHESRQFKSTSKNSQEAHEAIRPTHIEKTSVSTNPDQQKLYSLIRSRTLASQMAPAEVQKTKIHISISEVSARKFIAQGEIVTFEGFLKAYKGTKYMAVNDTLLPEVSNGDKLKDEQIVALERYSRPPARYSEASLVKKLEELGIGRPSTYAPTINKITSPTRGYVTKETREGVPTDFARFTLKGSKISQDVFVENFGTQTNRLFASDMGMIVTDFLDEHFSKIMQYSFTAQVEDKLDDVALGKDKWVDVVDSYYKPFKKNILLTTDKAERATGERVLGKDPKSGKTVLVRMSKYGPVAQIGQEDELAEGEKPQYANLLRSQNLETVEFDEVIKLFGLPKTLDEYKGKEILIGRGRFGPYVKYDDFYVSIPQSIDVFEITKAQAVELIKEKLEADKPITDYKDFPVTRGVGRFGPYLKWNDMYISIPKRTGMDHTNIDKKTAIELIEAKIQKNKENLIHEWNDGEIRLIKGRWGAVFMMKGKRGFIAIPKSSSGVKFELDALKKMEYEDIKTLITGKKSPAKKTVKKKKSTRKKTTTKK